MSEHKHNPMAEMKAQTGGRQLGAELQVAFVVKHNMLVLPGDRIRAKPDGSLEVFAVPPVMGEDGFWRPGPADHDLVWQAVMPGVEVIPEGTRLGIDRMDLVIALTATLVGGMLSADGRVMGKARHVRELYREDAQRFLATMGAGPRES